MDEPGDKRTSAKERICSAMLDLIEKEAFDEITVTEVARQAGVSRTIFYRNFDSVFDVLQHIEDAFLDAFPSERTAIIEFLGMSQRADKDGPYVTENYAQTVSGSLRMYRILAGPNGDPSFVARVRNRIKRVTAQTLEARLGQGTLEVGLIAEYLTGAQISALYWWSHHEDNVDAETTSRLIASLNANTMRSIVDTEHRLGIDIRAKDT